MEALLSIIQARPSTTGSDTIKIIFIPDMANLNRSSIYYRHRLLDVELYFGTDGRSDERDEKGDCNAR